MAVFRTLSAMRVSAGLIGLVLVGSALPGRAEESVPIYSQGITMFFLRGQSGPGRLTGRSFRGLYDPDKREVQCTLGVVFPSEDGSLPKIPNDGCDTQLIQAGDEAVLGLQKENIALTDFWMYLPPDTTEIPFLKFFLVQNLPFTVALHLDRPPEVSECNNPNGLSNAKSPCILGNPVGAIPTFAEIRDRLFADEDVILDKGAGEAIELRLLELREKMNGQGHVLYVRVLRNGFSPLGTPVISLFQAGVKVDALAYVNWFRQMKQAGLFDADGNPPVDGVQVALCQAARIRNLIDDFPELDAGIEPVKILDGGPVRLVGDGLQLPLGQNLSYRVELQGDGAKDVEKVYIAYSYSPTGSELCNDNGGDAIQWYWLRCGNQACSPERWTDESIPQPIKPTSLGQVEIQLPSDPGTPGRYSYYFGLQSPAQLRVGRPFIVNVTAPGN